MKTLTIIRTLRGLSQWDLSQATGIKNNRISYIERGRMKPRPEELEVIAKALDVSVDALTTDESKFLEAIGDTV